MIVFISDLHLTDGTSGRTIGSDAFRILRKQLGNLSYAASWRAAPSRPYAPLKKIHLVLLGDILDVIRSAKWLSGKVRPWHSPQSPEFQAKVKEITEAVLAHNADSVAVLRSIAKEGKITVPKTVSPEAKTRVDVEGHGIEYVPVPVEIYYQVGNHDWFFHLQGAAYDEIRREIVARLGLVNDPDKPFPHDPHEEQSLWQAMMNHRVIARHGDIYDSSNFELSRDASSLGDAIVIELLNRFPIEVERQMGSRLPEGCVKGIREIDNVRPMALVPVWLHGLLRRTCADEKQVDAIKKIWDGLVDEFLELSFVKEHDRRFRWDSVDTVEWMLKFSQGVSMRTLGQVAEWVRGKSFSGDDLRKCALREEAFLNRTAKFVVYGHTHRHEIVPLDIYVPDRIEQIYVNTGTWRRVHEQTLLNLNEQEFVSHDVMTYAAFYLPDERRGRAFETWSGALG